jgi:23S rRNA (uridine2552-2'-O)-methyltransferase
MVIGDAFETTRDPFLTQYTVSAEYEISVVPKPRKLHDRYFKQAKREGYVARSAYKLFEVQEKHRVLHPRDRVLDLGCAPGSWLQVASEIVGPEGLVIGIDLLPIRLPEVPGNVHAVRGDITKVDPTELLPPRERPDDRSEQRFDVVLSDMAPNTSGVAGGSADHFRSVRLCETVLEVADRTLKTHGTLVMKVFDGEAFAGLLKLTRNRYRRVACLKPKATREVSREQYVIAMNKKPSLRPLEGPSTDERGRADTADENPPTPPRGPRGESDPA